MVPVDIGPPVKQQHDDVHIEEDDEDSESPELLSRHNDDWSTSHGQAVQRSVSWGWMTTRNPTMIALSKLPISSKIPRKVKTN